MGEETGKVYQREFHCRRCQQLQGMVYLHLTTHSFDLPLRATAKHGGGVWTLHATSLGALAALRAQGGLATPKSAVIQVTPGPKPTESGYGARRL